MEFNKEVIFSYLKQCIENHNKNIDVNSFIRQQDYPFLLSRDNTLLPSSILNMAKIQERMRTCSFLFSQNRIPYAIVKGPVLSAAAYGNPFVRVSNDLDVLISPEYIEDIDDLLVKEGFIQARIVNNQLKKITRKEKIFQSMLTHQIPTYIKKTDNNICKYVILDVNTKIIFGESSFQPDVNYVLKQTEKMLIAGVVINKLKCELDFIFLCLHHYKDINSIYLLSQGSFRLDVFCDVFLYVENQKIDFNMLIQYCRFLNVGKYVYTILYYTSLIFPSEKLLQIVAFLQSERDDSLINCYGLSEEEKKVWKIGFYERLFHENLSNYIWDNLDEKDKEKIRINKLYM